MCSGSVEEEQRLEAWERVEKLRQEVATLHHPHHRHHQRRHHLHHNHGNHDTNYGFEKPAKVANF